MKVSTQTQQFSQRFGDEQAIERLARIGYDALDYSMFDMCAPDSPLWQSSFREYAKKLRRKAEDAGISFNQSHAPFPVYRQGQDDYNDMMRQAMIRSIEVTAILGGDCVIVHPTYLPENKKKFNMDFYNTLAPYCREFGVKVALENMFGHDPVANRLIPNVCSTAEEFVEYMDELDPACFVACLDIGHAGLVGETAENMILALGHNRLKALHVHDNNNVTDLHTLPFTQQLHWDKITDALREIQYSGVFTFEADNFLTRFPDELIDDASRLMLRVGRYLAERCTAAL